VLGALNTLNTLYGSFFQSNTIPSALPKIFIRSRAVYALRPSKPARAKARNKLIINNLTSPPPPLPGELQATYRRVTAILQTSQFPFRLPPTPLKAISARTDAFLQNLSATLGDTIAWHQRQQILYTTAIENQPFAPMQSTSKSFCKVPPFPRRRGF